jgi:hypothetical protein
MVLVLLTRMVYVGSYPLLLAHLPQRIASHHVGVLTSAVPAATAWNPEYMVLEPVRGSHGFEKEDSATEWFRGENWNSMRAPTSATMFSGVKTRPLAPTFTICVLPDATGAEAETVADADDCAETREAVAARRRRRGLEDNMLMWEVGTD